MNKKMSLSILALIVCGTGWASSAMAQPNEAAADGQILPPTAPLPGDIMRSTGKWATGVRLIDPANHSTQPAPPISSLPQFKLAEPAWICMLNTVGQIAASVRIEQSLFGISGKLGQPTPQINSPVPRTD
ncbi:hypothetical protein [Herbaspirillum rhizosphaerae]|uniref:hypothetical protein n=1 Tax=Herbaspirillum rhizosphaerae TaxID=346179 RepID=UPI00067D6BD8|nr:hypothetical protein [Herbaspirillum rhizosphaerae]